MTSKLQLQLPVFSIQVPKNLKTQTSKLDGFLIFHSQSGCECSGVGGIRTLVQTSNQKAFYTFSFFMVFDRELIKNTLLPT